MIHSIYKNYFQKSRSFLFPALGIKKGNFNPTQTFISLDEPPIKPQDRKLVCLFEKTDDPRFEQFEKDMLTGNPLFKEYLVTPSSDVIYIFDYEGYKTDWDNFLLGKYSRLSDGFKTAIKSYYGHNSKEYEYMDTYLYPELYFEKYAELLDVDLPTLLKVGELCDKYDPEKEKLIFSTINLETTV